MLVHTKWHILVQTKWPDADQIQTPSCTLPQLSGYEYDIEIAKAIEGFLGLGRGSWPSP